MSKQNREREYNRLLSLDRVKDMSQQLRDEFEVKVEVEAKTKPESKKMKRMVE